MSTIQELIDISKAFPYRKVYIKRRIGEGTFETNWQRVDIRADDGSNRILSYGVCSIEIDSDPSEIGNFDVSALTMIVDNSDGYFNVDTDEQSFWYGPYLNRKYSKLKVVVGYYDEDGTEVGEDTVFEGYIDKHYHLDNYQMQLNILSYQSILTRYNIYKLQEDATITGEMTVSQVVTAIMNQTYITAFIPYVAPSPGVDVTLIGTNSTYLTGTFWDVLTKLAFISNSIIYLVGDSFAFKERTPESTLVHSFKGLGTEEPDIYQLIRYDDEGGESVRVWWQAQGENLSSESIDATLLAKYLNQPQEIDLSIIKTNEDKQLVLDAYLNNWENPKPSIEFKTKFFINLIKPLDKISVEFLTHLSPLAFYWDDWFWDDGSRWSNFIGPYSITAGEEWMVTRVYKDIDDFSSTIRVEKIII